MVSFDFANGILQIGGSIANECETVVRITTHKWFSLINEELSVHQAYAQGFLHVSGDIPLLKNMSSVILFSVNKWIGDKFSSSSISMHSGSHKLSFEDLFDLYGNQYHDD